MRALVWILMVSVVCLMSSCSNNPVSDTKAGDTLIEKTLNINDNDEGSMEYSFDSPLYLIIIKNIPDDIIPTPAIAEKTAATKKNKTGSASVSPKNAEIGKGEYQELSVTWSVTIYNSTAGKIYISDRLTGDEWSGSFSRLSGKSSGKKYSVTVKFRKQFSVVGKHVIDTTIKLDSGENETDKNEAKITVTETSIYPYYLKKVTVNGKKYYLMLEEKNNNEYEVWARVDKNSCSSGDMKVNSIEFLKENAEDAARLICRGKDIYNNLELVVGCASTVGTAACIYTGAGGGSAINVCLVTGEYAINKGFVDCVDGLSDKIADVLGVSDPYNMAKSPTSISYAIDKFCEDVLSH